jgi:ABC-type phosphate transport system substrate-binding protein
MLLKCLIFSVLLCVVGSSATSLSVVTSSKNSVASVSQAEIEDLFMGRSFSFPDGKKVRIIIKTETDPDHKFFTEQFLKKSLSSFKSHWARLIFTGRARPPLIVNSDDQVKKAIAEDPSSLGYISTESLTSELKEISMLKSEN